MFKNAIAKIYLAIYVTVFVPRSGGKLWHGVVVRSIVDLGRRRVWRLALCMLSWVGEATNSAGKCATPRIKWMFTQEFCFRGYREVRVIMLLNVVLINKIRSAAQSWLRGGTFRANT